MFFLPRFFVFANCETAAAAAARLCAAASRSQCSWVAFAGAAGAADAAAAAPAAVVRAYKVSCLAHVAVLACVRLLLQATYSSLRYTYVVAHVGCSQLLAHKASQLGLVVLAYVVCCQLLASGAQN